MQFKPRHSRTLPVSSVAENLEGRCLFAAFAPGDLVVYRVGSGSAALSSASTAVFLDEYSPTGTPVQSLALPTAAGGGNNPLTASGTATSEGNLTLSQDGKNLLLTGYDATTGVASVASTNSTTSGAVTNATNATPIVITTPSTSGMANGQAVTISGVSGNTAANGSFFLKVVSSTTFSLYGDAALTQPVTGNGVYSSSTSGTWTDTALTTFTQREVGVVAPNGTVNTTTVLTGALSQNNVRGAASVDGTSGIYVSGAAGAVYTTLGSTAAPTSLSGTNLRSIEINGNQLYATSGTGTGAILGTLGTGLPTSGPQTLTQLPGIVGSGTSGAGLGGAYEFAFATLNGGTTPDTLYVADNYNDGIDKFSLVNGSWALNGEIGAYVPGQTTPLTGITGIVAEPVPGGEQLFATVNPTSTTSYVYGVVDPYGYNSNGGSAGTALGGVFSASPPLTTVATAATNEAFRGLGFVPQSALKVISQPASQSGVTSGSVSLFAAVAPGTNETVQWQVNTGDGTGFHNLANGANVSGATSDTLTLANLTTAQSGYQYQAVFNSAAGAATSNAATLTVINGPGVTSISPSAGPIAGGTSVTLTGLNFASGDTVSFGATPATNVTVVSATQITATAPAESAGTVDVTVASPTGVTSPTTAADQFTYAAAPAVSTVTPAKGIDSGGTPVVITGSGFLNGSTVTFGGVAATKVTVNSFTSITAVTPFDPGAGVVDVVVTTPAGTSTASTADHFTYTVTTNAAAQTLATGSPAILDNNPIVTAILSQPGTTNGVSYTNGAYLVNDGTGTVDVFGPNAGGYTPTVGDKLSIQGKWSPYSGIPQLGSVSSVNLISQGNTAAGPVTKTVSQVNQTTSGVAGQLVTLNNVTISGISGTFGTSNLTGTITDSSGASITLYYYPSTYSAANAFFDGLAIPTTPVNLTGIVQVYAGTTPEFIPISEPGTFDKFSMTNNATPTGEADGFGAVQRGSSVTVTVTRTESADVGSVDYTLTPDSAAAGTDYTGPAGSTTTAGVVTGTVTFPAGVTTQTVTITTAANPGGGGDRLFTVALTNPTTNQAGTILPAVTGGPATLVIQDPASSHTLANNSFKEEGVIQPAGPRATTATNINVEANNATNGANTSFGVLTYDDQNADPSHVFSLPAAPVGTIQGIELETVAAPASFDVSGPLNVYLVSNTLTSNSGVYPDGTLKFDTANDPTGGVGSQLGTRYLLGTIQYNATQAAGGYTPYNLTNLDPAGVATLKSALNNGSAFTIVVTPGNATVAASWAGSTTTGALQSPILRFDYSTSTVPAPAVVSVTPEDQNGQGVAAGSTTGGANTAGQRSMETQIAVVFNEPVNLAAGAFSLGLVNNYGSGTNDNTGNTGNTDVSAVLGTPANPSGDGLTWLIPIVQSGSSVAHSYNLSGGTTASLQDGIYQLGVSASAVTAAGGGAAMASAYTSPMFHRLFGDLQNSDNLNNFDLTVLSRGFRNVANLSGDLDYNGNGQADNLDLTAFSRNFNKSFTTAPLGT